MTITNCKAEKIKLTKYLNNGTKKVNNKKQLLLFNQKNLLYKALMYFQDTVKNEESFYLRFQTLPAEYLEALKESYSTDDEFRIYKLICKWWNIYGKQTIKNSDKSDK